MVTTSDISNNSGINTRKGLAIIIPVYNHAETVAEVVKGCLKTDYPVFVVDDGSTDSTFERLRNIKEISLLRHRKNRGKGAAIITGFKEVSRIADWALTIDADGQHDPADIRKLVRAIPPNTRPVIVGMRQGMKSSDAPWTSRFGRKFSNFWVWASGGRFVSDSQSGFRIYPLPETLNLKVRAKRFQFEVEVLVKAGWQNMPIIEVPVSVNYKQLGKRISHFRPFVDFMRNSMVFTRLIFLRILRGCFKRKV
jgi:glycosyltransferase involved in cell wall biosynthesis